MAKLTPVPAPGTARARAFYTEQEADTLARTLWGEARGEGPGGMAAVACVVLNRVAVARARGGRYWWGADVVSVCLAPWQFSCWNRADANYAKVRSVTEADPYFATALRVARRALAGALPDPTGGATHYHAIGASPAWAAGAAPTATIGRHVFYRLV
ncbi:MAG: cell wall hydrolase [Alphaproteobacteria bacterium]|jgi:N-acetylmuramoyl-L-alanine amidase|nr:cell wall hydrolase [Alphaproteobacteria bacterium]